MKELAPPRCVLRVGPLARGPLLVWGVLLAGLATPSPALEAFPGAAGQGAAAVGGRGGDVYHVTSLDDYHPRHEQKIEGTLRHALRSQQGPRTIVFDVSGPIGLRAPLEVNKGFVTIAGQTSPGGVTLWGYPLDIGDASTDVVVRHIRVRLGDFHAQGNPNAVGAADLDPSSANAISVGSGAQRVILDHVSAAWGMDETLSVTIARDVTIQDCMIAESLRGSYHKKGSHGYGSLIRGQLSADDQRANQGGYTLLRNLWALHDARNPSIGGQQHIAKGMNESQRLRADVNLINCVIYVAGSQATHRSDMGDVRVNLIGNYYRNSRGVKHKRIFRGGGAGRTELYHRGNVHDLLVEGKPVRLNCDDPAAQAVLFEQIGPEDSLIGPPSREPFGFYQGLEGSVTTAAEARAEVLRSAGASLWRDAVDRRVVRLVTQAAGALIDSQEATRDDTGSLPGIDDLPRATRPTDFDLDGDGMADEFERREGLDPADAGDRNGLALGERRGAAGFTNLEVYLDELTRSEGSPQRTAP